MKLLILMTVAAVLLGAAYAGERNNRKGPAPAVRQVSVRRCAKNPLITFASSRSLGNNINGPSVIRVPTWIKKPLGRYYMYFAHHHGTYIRLAYADSLEGPWQVYKPGTLKLSQAKKFRGHIASPDVHVDNTNRQILMFFHGPVKGRGKQWTGVATSKNGLDFKASEEILGGYYFRVFKRGSYYYALDGGGLGNVLRSNNPMKKFEKRRKELFEPMTVRHTALLVKRDILMVFYSRYGDTPERILVSTVRLGSDWSTWVASDPIEVIKPEKDYEGTKYPVKPSKGGSAIKVCELRDPCIFEENGRIYLFYTIVGEMGIAMAEIKIAM